jgi:diacylglycerol O-acyltransferase / wax synthase
MPMAVTDAIFLIGESREHPTHVGGLQLFQLPDGAGPEYVSDFYRTLLTHTDVSPLMRRRPHRSPATLGQWSWVDDHDIELDYHVRLSALPRPCRVRELLELVSRLHGALLDRHRPLWEFHLVEGLSGNRFATYIKVHHALMDGVTAMRELTRGLSTAPEAPSYPPWDPRPIRPERAPGTESADGTADDEAGGGHGSAESAVPLGGLIGAARGMARTAAELASAPPALTQALLRMAKDNGPARPYEAPATMFNVKIGGARRFVGQSWPLDRVRAIAVAAGATLNDVAVAMCGGALRRYLLDHRALPDRPLVAMIPVSLRATEPGPGQPTGAAGNAVGAVLCDLATEEPDPAARLIRVHASTRSAKEMMSGLTPTQILVLSTLLVGGAALPPLPGIGRFAPPAFNVVISNVPGRRTVRYLNGAELQEMYPLSIPIDGQAVNITFTSYVDKLAFGIVGCRRSVPSLQRMIDHLDAELTALEHAVR